MAPFDLSTLSGTIAYNLVFLALGMGFGAVLEVAGFGDSRKLSAQFYFTDMTVLKVMFTGIIVAMVLIFSATSLGLMDFNKVWVNPTYLWPGIVGGLIMGVGFIVGGFCPGTSMVAASTLKVDGIFFVLGGLFGVLAFGESVGSFEQFFNSSYMGRFTIPEWLGLPYGVVVILVLAMAIAMFYGAEISEAFFGRGEKGAGIFRLKSGGQLAGTAALLLAGGFLLINGQPSAEQRWRWIEKKESAALLNREYQVSPAEVVELKKDMSLSVDILDLRSEPEFNRFHITGSRRVSMADLQNPAFLKNLSAAPDNTIRFVLGNGEKAATDGWKLLKAQGIINLYIVEGGINRWLDMYPLPSCIAGRLPDKEIMPDTPAYVFSYSVGEKNQSAHPDFHRSEPLPSCAISSAKEHAEEHGQTSVTGFIRKVKLQKKKAAKGGCG